MPGKRDRIHVLASPVIGGGWIVKFNGEAEPINGHSTSHRNHAIIVALINQKEQPIYLHNPDGTVHCVIQPEA